MLERQPIKLRVPCRGKVVCGFCGRLGVDDAAANDLPETIDSTFGGFSQICFELGEGILDWAEVGAVGWKIEKRCAGGFDHLADTRSFVAGEVVHDDNRVLCKLGDQHFFHVGLEGITVDRAVEHPGRDDGSRG